MTQIPGSENRPSKYARRRAPITELVSRFLARSAQRFKEVYILERQAYEEARGSTKLYRPPKRFDGGAEQHDGAYRSGKVAPNVWQVQTKKLLEEHLDPVEYVQHVFLGLAGSGRRPPGPDQILQEAFRAGYDRARRQEGHQVKISLEVQARLARQRIIERQACYGYNPEDALVDVLLDEGLDLSWLFRYCLAAASEHPRAQELADDFFVGAVIQYMRSHREYKRHWGPWIPHDFPKQASTVYDELIR